MSTSTSFMKQCERENLPCWICGEEIDYGPDRRKAPNKDRQITKDHYWPTSLRPDLRWVKENYRAAHALCNSRRSNRTPERTVWIGSMREGRWFDETLDQAARRIAREMKKRRFYPSPTAVSAQLTWSERWAASGPLKDNGTPKNPYKRPEVTPTYDDVNGIPTDKL